MCVSSHVTNQPIVQIIKEGYLFPTSGPVLRVISSGLRQFRRPFSLVKPRIQDDQMGWPILDRGNCGGESAKAMQEPSNMKTDINLHKAAPTCY